jgi:hypothetical protein
LPGRNLSKADVCVYRRGEQTVALKDFGGRPFAVRQTLGRLFVRRECRAYERASGSPGLVPYLGRIGAFALATAWVDASPLAECASAGDEVFDRLDAILDGLHERGVAIVDLHHRDVLIGPDRSVHIVDLAAAFVLGPQDGRMRRFLFARARAQDRIAAARMRARFTGRSEEDALAGLDPHAVRLWGIGRSVKSFWNRLRRREP